MTQPHPHVHSNSVQRAKRRKHRCPLKNKAKPGRMRPLKCHLAFKRKEILTPVTTQLDLGPGR